MLHESSPDEPALVWQSIRQQREQAGGANANTGEQTVNPEGFWRRSRDGWSHGGGQSYGDRDESDALRFRDSRGVNVFDTKHQLTLLRKVDAAYTMTGSGQAGVYVGGNRIYAMNGGEGDLVFTATPFTLPWSPTAVTGLPATLSATSYAGFAANGSTGYVACGGDGIYSTSLGGSTASSFVTGTVQRVWWVKGRLMATDGSAVYNVVAGGALPTALYTFTSTGPLDMCDGPNHIYILSYDNGPVVYKTAVKPDGTALDVPTVAGRLVTGDFGFRIFAHAGLIFVGTTQGVYMATVDSDGNLTFGSKIPLDDVYTLTSFAAADQYVWVGNVTTDEGPTLLRLDLTNFVLPNTPSYAHDLSVEDASVTDDVRTMVSYGTFSTPSRRIFTSLRTVYVESADEYVDSGYVDSGLLALDLADAKTPVAIDVEAAYPDDASITEAISVDRGASFTNIDTFDDGDQDEAPIAGVAASRQFELRTTLTASTDNTETPVLYRHTLKAEPNVSQGDYVVMRLRLFEAQVDHTGSSTGRTPNDDIAFLQALQRTREVIDLQAGSLNYTATLRDLDLTAETRCASGDDGSWNTVGVARFKIVTAA